MQCFHKRSFNKLRIDPLTSSQGFLQGLPLSHQQLSVEDKEVDWPESDNLIIPINVQTKLSCFTFQQMATQDSIRVLQLHVAGFTYFAFTGEGAWLDRA